MRPLRLLGRLVLAMLAHLGRFSLMVVEALRGLREWRVWIPRTFTESYNIGVGSLFIVFLISAFAGAVTAFQAGYQWHVPKPLEPAELVSIVASLLSPGDQANGPVSLTSS